MDWNTKFSQSWSTSICSKRHLRAQVSFVSEEPGFGEGGELKLILFYLKFDI